MHHAEFTAHEPPAVFLAIFCRQKIAACPARATKKTNKKTDDPVEWLLCKLIRQFLGNNSPNLLRNFLNVLSGIYEMNIRIIF